MKIRLMSITPIEVALRETCWDRLRGDARAATHLLLFTFQYQLSLGLGVGQQEDNWIVWPALSQRHFLKHSLTKKWSY